MFYVEMDSCKVFCIFQKSFQSFFNNVRENCEDKYALCFQDKIIEEVHVLKETVVSINLEKTRD